MSEFTPRTDDLFDGEADLCPAAEFARELERELNQWRKVAESIRPLISHTDECKIWDSRTDKTVDCSCGMAAAISAYDKLKGKSK